MNKSKLLTKENLKSFLSSDKARIIFVIIGVLAIFLIFLSGQFADKDKQENITPKLSSADYCSTLTTELINMLENLEGVGKADVLLTLESSYEYIYLDDDKTLTKILEPKIRGVAVTCTGGDDPVVKEKVSKLLSTVLSISAGSISVGKSI